MKKRALSLVVAVACASGLLGACSRPTPEEMLSSAKGYLAKNDNKAAILQLKNVLQQKSDIAEARFLLGKALLESGNAVAAGVELRKALDLGYPEAEAAPLLARSLLATREFRKLTEQYGDVVLEDDGADADLKATLAAAYAAQGDREHAKAMVRAALKAVPGHMEASLLEVRLAMGERQLAQALALVDRIVAAHPDDREALVLRGDVLLYKGDNDGALAAYRKVQAVDPDHLRARVGVIDRLLARHDVAAARVEIEALRKSHPKTLQSSYYDSQLAFLDGDYKRAGELVENLLKVVSGNAKVLELAGAIELKKHATVRAADYFTKALQISPGLLGARRLLAQTYIESGQPEKAVETLEPLVSRGDADATTLNLAAAAEARAGNAKRAEAHIVRAARLDPDAVQSRIALALDRSKDTDLDSAIGEIEKIAAADSGAYADFVLVNAHMRQGHFDKALKSVEAIARKQPDKPYAANLRGRIQYLRKDTAAARRSFEQALSIDPGFVPAAASLALLDLAEKKPADAKKRLEALVAANPTNTQALLAFAGVQERVGAPPDEIRKLFARAVAADASDISARLALVEHHLRRRDTRGAVTSAQEGLAALPGNPLMIDALARAQLADGDRNQAIASLNKLAALQPASPQPHVRIASLHLQGRAYDEARRSVQRALAMQPRLVPAQRLLAEIEFRAGRPEEALAVARTLRKQEPTKDTGYLLEGSLEAARKNLAAAADVYRAGLKQAASTELAMKLYATLGAMESAADAEKFAASWTREHPKDARFISFLGEVALGDAQPRGRRGALQARQRDGAGQRGRHEQPGMDAGPAQQAGRARLRREGQQPAAGQAGVHGHARRRARRGQADRQGDRGREAGAGAGARGARPAPVAGQVLHPGRRQVGGALRARQARQARCRQVPGCAGSDAPARHPLTGRALAARPSAAGPRREAAPGPPRSRGCRPRAGLSRRRGPARGRGPRRRAASARPPPRPTAAPR